MKMFDVKKSLLLIITGSFILLFGTMGTGFMLLWNEVAPPDPQAEFEELKDDGNGEGKDEVRPIHPLDTFIVNLSDRGAARYLRTSMVLELTNEEAVGEVKRCTPHIRDIILMVIPSKTSRDIKTVVGKNALGEEIMSEINYVLKSGSVSNIYFTEFVIQ